MAQIIVRNIEESIKRRLKRRAASHGRSMEEEAREILKAALKENAPSVGLGTLIASLFKDIEIGDELDKAIEELRSQEYAKPIRFDE